MKTLKFTLTRTDEKGTMRVTTITAQYFFDRMKTQRKIPSHEVFPGAEMKKDGNGRMCVRAWNSIVVLTVGNLSTVADVEAVKATAMTLPTTMAAFCGADGRSVKIMVRYAAAEDTALPDDETAVDAIAEAAYEQAFVTYSRIMNQSIEHEKASARMSFRMSLDPHVLVNAEAVPITMSRFGLDTMKLIDMLTARYEFRFNTILGYTEYRVKMVECQRWLPVDDRVVNGITMGVRLSGLDAWDKDVKRYVQSNMVSSYNPILTFLEQAKKQWDGRTDHIARLAATVPCNVPQWGDWFRKWLLYMVAQWMGHTRRYGNSVAPLLISEQGNNKSTFCRQLLPDDLQWGYNDNLLVSEKKQTLQAMAQFLLINLDEFNQISAKIQEGFLKNVIQMARVKIKRPYGKHVEDFQRLASFIATTNEPSVLADPSGNRRFIGIELTGIIDVSQPINYYGLYGQAVTLIERGERYWFNDAEVRDIMAHNRRFQIQSPAEQWFNEQFAIAADESEGEWLTSAAIFNRIRHTVGSSFQTNLLAFGRTLTHMEGIRQKHSNIGKLYLVRQKR